MIDPANHVPWMHLWPPMHIEHIITAISNKAFSGTDNCFEIRGICPLWPPKALWGMLLHQWCEYHGQTASLTSCCSSVAKTPAKDWISLYTTENWPPVDCKTDQRHRSQIVCRHGCYDGKAQAACSQATVHAGGRPQQVEF